MLGAAKAAAQKNSFAAKWKAAIERVEQEANKDPETFKANMARLEKEWGERKDPVEQSVVHAMMGSAYRAMKWTSITDHDEETRAEFDTLSCRHFRQALSDMEVLADAKSAPYAVMLQEKGRDSELYGNDMLSVLLSFVKMQSPLDEAEDLMLQERAFRLYRQRGNLNAYAIVKMQWLEDRRQMPMKLGRLTGAQYLDSLRQLFQEVKGEEIGADVAMVYTQNVEDVDKEILFLREVIGQVTHSRRKGELKRSLDSAERPSVHVEPGAAMLANRPCEVTLRFWNCERVTLTVRQFTGWKQGADGQRTPLQTGAVVARQEVVLPIDSANAARKAQQLPVRGNGKAMLTLPAGHYVAVVEGLGDNVASEFHVSTLHMMATELGPKTWRVYVLDAETGRPQAGVKVQGRKNLPADRERTSGWESRDLTFEQVTGADGVVDVEKGLWVRAVRNEQDYTNYNHPYGAWYPGRAVAAKPSVRVLTDRGLYRPGQKVEGTVVAFTQWGDTTQVLAGERLTLTATDAQRRQVARVSLQTNEWGTASFVIDLPADCAVGRLSLLADNENGVTQHAGVEVEEYRRPTFDVCLDGPKRGQFGQTVEAVGTVQMLAGVPVQGAQVRYVVECASQVFRRWWNGYVDWEEVATGELTTNDEGQFKVPVRLSDEWLKGEHDLMRYRVTATATDQRGESHEAVWTLGVSRVGLAFHVEVSPVVDLAKQPSFTVKAYDANHEPVKTTGRWRLMCGEQQLLEDTLTTDEDIRLPRDLQQGVQYELQAFMYDHDGKVVTDQWGTVLEHAAFTPYSSDLKVTDFDRLGTAPKQRAATALTESNFLYSDSTTFVEGGTVDLYFATQATDAYIIYNVYGANGLLESHRAVTDGSIKRLRLRHRKEWGDGIVVQMLGVRDGKDVVLGLKFERAKPDKKLTLAWNTFRDKLQPGQQEQWTLTVTGKDGKTVSGAEMMAVLYDAALDRIRPHQWTFDLSFPRRVPNLRSMGMGSHTFPATFLEQSMSESGKDYVRQYDRLKAFEHDRYRYLSNRMLRTKSATADAVHEVAVGAQRASNDMAVPMAGPTLGGMLHERVVTNSMDVAEEDEELVDFDQAALRGNFAETAFFMPHLVSDAQGQVQLRFTLPESLTEWKFMGLAHTKEVDYGLLKATAVARKQFMLQPNVPRFVRWGDKAVVASSVVNQSEEAQKGKVRLRLLNAVTDSVVWTEEKPFAVGAGQTVAVAFSFEVQEAWKDLMCEVIAVSGQTSDGEKHSLPVLTTKQAVVESVPYYIMGHDDGSAVEKAVDLSQLFNDHSSTATQRTLTVEYTDNPAWMCVEALRSVKNPTEENAIDFAAALYANTRLLELMQTFPMLERYDSVADLQRRTATAQQRLTDLQQNDGGWSWFKGMESNRWVTQAVCEQLAKLPQPTEAVRWMLERGMAYLDGRELETYRQWKKQNGKMVPSDANLRYLYLSAQMPKRVVDKDVQRMRDDYLSKIAKTPRDLTIYGVANAAFALRAFGQVKSANAFVDFLKDYMVEKPGQGRFFATDAAYYSWMDYRIPTQVAAMKAIRQRDAKDAVLNDMQLWLLAQKQVQKWDNPMNTIDVVDLLLQVAPLQTFHVTAQPVLKVDGVVLQPAYGTLNNERERLEGREPRLELEGNVLAEVPSTSLQEGVRQLHVTKQTPGLSWGMAYATFVEDMDKLNAYATNELKVERKLYVQKAGSEQWKECGKKTALKVGDKVRVRHIVSADRDMDFVRLTAQHPACFEPIRQLSGYQWLGGRGGYLALHDAHFDVFFDWFTRGTATIDLEYYVTRPGEYAVGVSSVECAYAKQFGAHTGGMRISAGNGK